MTYVRKRDGGGKTQFTVWIDSAFVPALKRLSKSTGKGVTRLIAEFAEKGGLKKLL